MDAFYIQFLINGMFYEPYQIPDELIPDGFNNVIRNYYFLDSMI